jgi:hypothetical protein
MTKNITYGRDFCKSRPTFNRTLMGKDLDHRGYEQLDTVSLKRLKEVERLPSDLKEKIYFFIDVSVRDFKAYAS